MAEAIIAGLLVILLGAAFVFARRDAAGGVKTELQKSRAKAFKALADRKRAKNVADLLARARRRRGD